MKVKDISGQLRRCAMNAMDKLALNSTFQCNAISDCSNMLLLNALKFNIEDKSPSIEVGTKLFGSGTKSTFSKKVRSTFSFNIEASLTKTYMITDKTDVSVEVPKDTKVTINLLRTMQDLECKFFNFSAVFELLRKYSAKWVNGGEIFREFDDCAAWMHNMIPKPLPYAVWERNFHQTHFIVFVTETSLLRYRRVFSETPSSIVLDILRISLS